MLIICGSIMIIAMEKCLVVSTMTIRPFLKFQRAALNESNRYGEGGGFRRGGGGQEYCCPMGHLWDNADKNRQDLQHNTINEQVCKALLYRCLLLWFAVACLMWLDLKSLG